MSSASIRSSIHACDAEIAACAEELKNKIAEKITYEDGFSNFRIKRSEMEDGISKQKQKAQTVESFAQNSNFAKRFIENMEDCYRGASYNKFTSNLQDMYTEITQLIETAEREEAQLEERLRQLEVKRGRLQSQYNEALRAEAEAAAAARTNMY